MGTFASLMHYCNSNKNVIDEYDHDTLERNKISPNRMDWFDVLYNKKVTLDFLLKYKHYVDRYCGIRVLSYNPYIADDMVVAFVEDLDLEIICRNRKISSDCANTLLQSNSLGSVKIMAILKHYSVSDSMLDRILFYCDDDDVVNTICKYQTISESMMRAYATRLNWNLLSKYQKLSPTTTQKYKAFVDCDIELTADDSP